MTEPVPDQAEFEPAPSRTWNPAVLFDAGAVALLLVVLFRAVGGIISAISLPSPPSFDVSAQVVGSSDISTYERLQFASNWGNVLTAVVLALALAAVVVPRMVGESAHAPAWPRRGPVLLAAVATEALLASVASGVAIFDVIGHPGLTGILSTSVQEAGPVAEFAGALALTLPTVVAAGLVGSRIRRATEPGPVADTDDHTHPDHLAADIPDYLGGSG